MTNQHLLEQIRNLIARDELPAALEKMRLLLGNNPKLDDTIHQDPITKII